MNKKVKNKLYIISILIAFLVLSLSFGYAFFTDSLTINGVASTVDYYNGNMLPTNPIMLVPSENRYHEYDTTRSKLKWRKDYWVGDTFITIWNKEAGIAISRKTITYTVSFTNPTELPYTNGQISTEIMNNGLGYIKSATGSLSKTTVNPGESVEVKLTITSNFLSRLNDQDIKATISYDLQGEKRYFYFIVKYRGWDNE